MLTGKEILEKLLDHLDMTPGAFAKVIGLKLELEYGYILNDIDLKKEVWKLKEELEELKKKLYI